MTPEDRVFAARRLRELAANTERQMAALDGHLSERQLLLAVAGSVAVLLAEVLAAVIEDRPEVSGR